MPNILFTPKIFTVGDRRTSIADTLVDADGTVIDLTSHTVTFRMCAMDETVKVNSVSANVDNATAGAVSYDWATADVDTAADYWAWWIVTRTGDGKVEHFPGDGKKYKVVFKEFC